MYHPFTRHIPSRCVAIFALVFWSKFLSQESAKEKKSDAKAAKAEKAKDRGFIPQENHRKTIGKWWFYGKIIGKP